MNRPVVVALSAMMVLWGCGAPDGRSPTRTPTVDATIPETETIEPAPAPSATTSSVPRVEPPITDPAY